MNRMSRISFENHISGGGDDDYGSYDHTVDTFQEMKLQG